MCGSLWAASAYQRMWRNDAINGNGHDSWRMTWLTLVMAYLPALRIGGRKAFQQRRSNGAYVAKTASRYYLQRVAGRTRSVVMKAASWRGSWRRIKCCGVSISAASAVAMCSFVCVLFNIMAIWRACGGVMALAAYQHQWHQHHHKRQQASTASGSYLYAGGGSVMCGCLSG